MDKIHNLRTNQRSYQVLEWCLDFGGDNISGFRSVSQTVNQLLLQTSKVYFDRPPGTRRDVSLTLPSTQVSQTAPRRDTV